LTGKDKEERERKKVARERTTKRTRQKEGVEERKGARGP